MKKSEKCIEMLEALGITDVCVYPAVGHWKKHIADVYAWEFNGDYNGLSVVGGCYDTMTECVKAGRLTWNREDHTVHAATKSP